MQVTTNEQINPLILGNEWIHQTKNFEKGRTNVITHLSDLEELFPWNEIISDKVQVLALYVSSMRFFRWFRFCWV